MLRALRTFFSAPPFLTKWQQARRDLSSNPILSWWMERNFAKSYEPFLFSIPPPLTIPLSDEDVLIALFCAYEIADVKAKRRAQLTTLIRPRTRIRLYLGIVFSIIVLGAYIAFLLAMDGLWQSLAMWLVFLPMFGGMLPLIGLMLFFMRVNWGGLSCLFVLCLFLLMMGIGTVCTPMVFRAEGLFQALGFSQESAIVISLLFVAGILVGLVLLRVTFLFAVWMMLGLLHELRKWT